VHFERVDFMSLFIGYAEALPAANASSLFAWTPDTNSYKDVNFKFNQIAATFINGTHRSIDGFSIYSGNAPFALGFFWLNGAPSQPGYPSGTITHYYDECWSNNTGEHSRFSGVVNITGGHLSQCGGPYIRWDANYSTVDAQITMLQIYGNGNTFKHTGICTTCLVDNGVNNKVDAATDVFGGPNGVISAYANRPHEPLNKLDTGFLLSGNRSTPFTSANDLLITCDQFNFAFQNYGTGPGCTSDPGGTEITQSYLHMVQGPSSPSQYVGSWSMGPRPSGQGSGPYGKLLTIGDRLPQAKMTFLMVSRCNQPCTQQINIYDDTSATLLYSQTLSFGTAWTLQTIAVDFSAIPAGHNISLFAPSLSGAGLTYQDLALLGFEPVNTDTINGTIAALLSPHPLGAAYLTSTTGSNTDLTGRLEVSSATSASYTFTQGPNSGHCNQVNCFWQPQFNIGSVSWWDTSTGSQASVATSAPVTGTFGYFCVVQN
jgi:hypothetical protein